MQQDDLSAFEAKLRRSLMPVAMSEAATESIHEMLDELNRVIESDESAPRSWISWPAAAAAVMLLFGSWLVSPKISDLAFQMHAPAPQQENEWMDSIHLVDEFTQLSWVSDAGWYDDPDGSALRAVHMRVIEENRLLDAETGIIVHVTSPREEMLLMPVQSF